MKKPQNVVIMSSCTISDCKGIIIMEKTEIDMINGPLARKILVYSVPLMFSNLFQVFFNLTYVSFFVKFA